MDSSSLDPRDEPGRLSVGSWLVRRAGIARVSAASVLSGLVLSALLEPSAGPLLFATAVVWGAVLVAAATRAGRGVVPVLVLIGCLAAGAAWGSTRVAALQRSVLQVRAGDEVELELEATGPARRGGGFVKIPARVVGDPGGRPLSAVGERVLATVTGECGEIDEGRRLHARGGIRMPQGPGPSGFDEASYLERMGIHCVVEIEAADLQLGGRRGGIPGMLDGLRRRARANLSRGVPPTYGALLRGVVLGDTEGIPDEIITAFRRSGTSHVLSVSGLHVAGLAALILSLLAAMRLPRAPSLGLSLAVVGVFAALTGAGPAVVRSAVMLTLVLLARASGRRADRSQVLCVAAVVVLIPNPLLVFTVAFQLSFAAVAGLVFLAPWLESRARRILPGAVASGIAVSLAATTATAPVSMLTFGQVSVVGVIANLVIVPVVTPVMGLGFASIVTGFGSVALTAWLDRLAAVLLAFSATAARLFARGPVISREHVGAVTAAGLGMALVPLLVKRVPRSRGERCERAVPGRPLRRRVRRSSWLRRPEWRARLSLLALAAGGLAGLVGYGAAVSARGTALTWVGEARWPAEVEVRMLDVGEGSAALVRTPGHQAALLDAGPPRKRLVEQLRVLGVRRLDVVLLSHPHADHFGGLSELAGVMPVDLLVDSVVAPGGISSRAEGEKAEGEGWEDLPSEARDYLATREAMVDSGTTYRLAANGGALPLGPVGLQLYVPARPFDPSATSWDGELVNAASIVTVASSGGLAILVPGDAEAAVMARYRVPSVDVLFVPHHGSAGAVSARLLAAWRPELACISVGAGNTFGHPAPDTLATLAEAGVPVMRTDRSGFVAVTPRSGGVGPRVLVGHDEQSGWKEGDVQETRLRK